MVTEQDNLIIYFSGHGRQHERRGGYWIPVEAGTSDDDWSDYISNDVIKSYLSKIKSFHTFLIADSCFSGSLFIDKSKEKFSGDRRDTEPSRWGLTSGKKEIVSDGRPGTHSPFATALLDVLRNADQPPGVMRICDLVQEKVASNAEQTPLGSPLQVSGHQGGQMVLYFRQNEEADWTAAQKANIRQSYSNFYRKYPHGKYANQALAKLESVEEKDIWDRVPKNREYALLRYVLENPYSPFIVEAERLINKLNKLPIKPFMQPEAIAVLSGIIATLLARFKMVFVKGGTFYMGEKEDTHLVTLSDFLIAKYPLTFEEYDSFCKATKCRVPKSERWGRGQRPVINVSWFDAINYCNWRSQKEGLQVVYSINKKEVNVNWMANGYRLPTEAEWEYAARGGQQSQGFKYAGSDSVDEVAWYYGNSSGKNQPIGQKKPNELGLYDMSGNVGEWCWDWAGDYPLELQKDPHGAKTGFARIVRGGGWLYNPFVVHMSINEPSSYGRNIGFRIARTLSRPEIALQK